MHWQKQIRNIGSWRGSDWNWSRNMRLCWIECPPEDRELLLDYMDVVGNMQYRISQLAWLYGKLHPHE